jgi:diaminopimelate decarboxylase
VSVLELVAEHGSPLWLADVDRARERLAGFRAEWEAAWPEVDVAYSYKTNRLGAFLHALHADGAAAEVVCGAEYAMARDLVGVEGARIIVNGPAKPPELLRRAAADGALVIVDSLDELERAAAVGVRRAGLRVAQPGFSGLTRFGIPAADIVAAGRRAAALGLDVEALSVHLVSTDLTAPLTPERSLAGAVAVTWPGPPRAHAEAAATLARLAGALAGEGVAIDALDLGGGFPAAPAVAAHAAAAAQALRGHGFAGRVVLEPGRALVADAVDLACTVVATKALPDGRRCAVVDAGTNLVPGALWGWPRVEALGRATGSGDASSSRWLLSGPLCLNVDVLHRAADLGDVRAGDVLVVRDVGAYQQAHSTQFGEPRPAVVVRDGGQWRLGRRREELADLVAGELGSPVTLVHQQEDQPWSA